MLIGIFHACIENVQDLNPKGPKCPNMGCVLFLFLESELWSWVDTYLGNQGRCEQQRAHLQ